MLMPGDSGWGWGWGHPLCASEEKKLPVVYVNRQCHCHSVSVPWPCFWKWNRMFGLGQSSLRPVRTEGSTVYHRAEGMTSSTRRMFSVNYSVCGANRLWSTIMLIIELSYSTMSMQYAYSLVCCWIRLKRDRDRGWLSKNQSLIKRSNTTYRPFFIFSIHFSFFILCSLPLSLADPWNRPIGCAMREVG